jgi:hypothetical protein
MFKSSGEELKFILDVRKYFHIIFVNICTNRVKNTYNITVLPKNELSSNSSYDGMIDFRNEDGDFPHEIT